MSAYDSSINSEFDTDHDAENESPTHFSLTNFLFGNVDKHGHLEDFGDDEEERVALNQLGRAHVSELDQAVEYVITENETVEKSPIADDASMSNADSAIEDNCAEDFYDINETLDEPEVDLSKVEVSATPGDDEDYDADDSQETCQSSTIPQNADIKILSMDTELSIKADTETSPVIIKDMDEDTKSMPPPQIIPAVSPALKSAINQNPSQVVIDNQEINAEYSATPITIDVEQRDQPPAFQSQPTIETLNESQQSTNKLNTPLGNMMPEEYANVDIRDLFPEYNPDLTPRWSKLFKPVYPISLYKDICMTTFDNPLWNDDREHVFYECLDMGRVAKLDEILCDDTEKLRAYKGSAAEAASNAAKSRKIKEEQAKAANGAQGNDQNSKKPSWRNGPAKLWYDMLGLPNNVDISKVNFSSLARSDADKTSSNNKEEKSGEEKEDKQQDGNLLASSDTDGYHLDLDAKAKENQVYARIPTDVLVPINQVNWEDDIIWDPQQSANKIVAGHRTNAAYAGWFPTNSYRTMAKFQDAYCTEYPGILPSKSTGTNTERADPATWHSIFPVENRALISGEWLKDIIWDINDMPPPSLLTLDPNDENLLPLDMPVEESPSVLSAMAAKLESQASAAVKRGADLTPNKMNKSKDKDSSKTRLLLGRHGLLKEDDKPDDDEEMEEETPLSPQKKDPFNLSNDEYYYPRQMSSTRTTYVSGPNIGFTCGAIIQHSTPAMELRHPFFPLHLNVQRLRHFHRPLLKRYNRGPMSQYNMPHPVCNLAKHIRKKGKQREEERAACGGGEIFFMRTPGDLSGMDGDLILAEYSEEFPPLMMQVGMNTRMLNYYKRPSSKEAGCEVAPPHLKYGELVYVHQSPFLGQLKPGQCLQTLENNMYRAPVYSHQMEPTDLLVVRNRNGFYIRKVSDILTVGQCYPLMEVPAPNSKKANNFIRDALQVYIYRLFWKSSDEPRKIKIEDVRKAFPNHSESSVRKRLKLCSDFKRTGADASWWVLRQDFRLPTEEELRAMVSPEDYCAYFSMAAAEQRLKDAGYGEKYLFPPPGEQEEDEEKESQVKMADEVRAAPWNTSHAYLSAMRGKCYLELHGAADPTGCGEAFSFAKVSSKPGAILKEGNDLMGALANAPVNSNEPVGTGVGLGRRMVTGTDADLRKLHLRDAKAMLKNLGIDETEIKKLKRWDVINVIRTISTLKAKKGEEEGMAKFARGSRLSTTEQLERYKEECQQIFDLQNRVMTSEEILSTDDASSSDPDEGDSDLEEVRHIESVLSNKITSSELRQRREEHERRQLQKKIDSGEAIFDGKKQRRKPVKTDGIDIGNNSLANFDESSRNNNDLTNQSSAPPGNKVLVIRRKFETDDGKSYWRTETVPWGPVADIYFHLRSNRSLNFIKEYVGSDDHEKELMRREKRREQDKKRRQNKLKGQRPLGTFTNPIGYQGDDSNQGDSDLIRKKTKPMTAALSKMRCGACGATGHMRTNKECPKYNQPNARAERPAPAGKIVRKYRTKKRMAKIREMTGGLTVEELLAQEKKDLQPEGMPFEDSELTKVEGTKLKMSGNVMRYFEKQNKSDLKMKIPRKIIKDITEYQEYMDQQEKQAAKSKKTKGKSMPSTPASRAELQRGDYSTSTKNRGNRRRIDPKVALNHLLEQIYKGIQNIRNYKTFLYPPKDREFPLYKEMIKEPMHLLAIRQKIQNNEYSTRQEFMTDINLIRENCVTFNGEHSEFTETATNICSYVLVEFASKERKFMRLERMVNPLLDENDLVGFNYLLLQIVESLFKVENSRPFHQPVDKKRYKDYYTRVQNPMDLKTIESKTKSSKYRSRDNFLNDVEQIVNNCITYNGEANALTNIAKNILSVAQDKIKEFEKTLDDYEAIIRSRGEELSVTGMDTDSVAEPSIHTDHQSQAGETFDIPTTPHKLNPTTPTPSTSAAAFGAPFGKSGDNFNTSFESNDMGEGGFPTDDVTKLLNLTTDDDDADDEEEDGAPERKRLKFSVEDEKKKLEGDLRLSDSDEEMDESVVSSPQEVSQATSKINSPRHDISQTMDTSLPDHLVMSDEEDHSQYFAQNVSRDLSMSDEGDSVSDQRSPVKFYIGEDTNDGHQSQSNKDDNDLADQF